MRRLIGVLLVFLICGCQHSGKVYNFVDSSKYGEGYVVNRKGVIIPEYTIGKDFQPPEDLELAKERFRRRRGMVEKYYRQMGVIVDSGFEMFKTMAGVAAAPVVLPFKIVDYKRYREDPEYRKEVDEAEEKALQEEMERNEKLKEELAQWVAQDLEKEAQKKK